MNPEISPPSNRIGRVHFGLKFPSMKKSELLHALQTEIQKHNLSTFMDEKDKTVITGCTLCRKHELDAALGLCIRGVWEKWLSRGYGVHEIATVMSMKIWETTMEYILQYDKKDDVREGVKDASGEQKN
jgi:hypothetical protein